MNSSVIPRTEGVEKQALVGPLRLLFLTSIVAFVAAITPQVAQGNVFSHYHLTQPCCNGDMLLGTRVSIETPASPISIPSNQGCVLARTSVESAPRLMQVGVVKCAVGSFLDNPPYSCSTSNNQVVYIESATSGTNYRCYPQGGIGNNVNVRVSVHWTTMGWQVYINGSPRNIFNGTFAPASIMLEGAEYTRTCGATYSVGYIDYGLTDSWQRSNGSSWIQVQSSYANGLNACGWQTTGGPAFGWSQRHP